MSPKGLDRYVQQFGARNNLRDEDVGGITTTVTIGMHGKHRKYVDGTEDKGLDTNVRS